MANQKKFVADLRAFGAKQPQVISQLMRRAALAIFSDLVKGSPVDTGRFRASWMPAVGRGDYSTVAPEKPKTTGKKTKKKQKQTASAASAESMTRLVVLNPQTVTGKEPIYITNNLPYGPALADGHSDQAPSGWIQAAVERQQREMSRVKVKT